MSLFVFHIVLLYIKSLSLLMSEVHEFFLAFFLVSATFCVFFFYILCLLVGYADSYLMRISANFLSSFFYISYELSSSLITRYPVMPRYLVVIVLTL